MVILQTAERSTHLDSSENVIYQRHLVAYKQASKLIHGTVLEIGTGTGMGTPELVDVPATPDLTEGAQEDTGLDTPDMVVGQDYNLTVTKADGSLIGTYEISKGNDNKIVVKNDDVNPTVVKIIDFYNAQKDLSFMQFQGKSESRPFCCANRVRFNQYYHQLYCLKIILFEPLI